MSKKVEATETEESPIVSPIWAAISDRLTSTLCREVNVSSPDELYEALTGTAFEVPQVESSSTDPIS